MDACRIVGCCLDSIVNAVRILFGVAGPPWASPRSQGFIGFLLAPLVLGGLAALVDLCTVLGWCSCLASHSRRGHGAGSNAVPAAVHLR